MEWLSASRPVCSTVTAWGWLQVPLGVAADGTNARFTQGDVTEWRLSDFTHPQLVQAELQTDGFSLDMMEVSNRGAAGALGLLCPAFGDIPSQDLTEDAAITHSVALLAEFVQRRVGHMLDRHNSE